MCLTTKDFCRSHSPGRCPFEPILFEFRQWLSSRYNSVSDPLTMLHMLSLRYLKRDATTEKAVVGAVTANCGSADISVSVEGHRT